MSPWREVNPAAESIEWLAEIIAASERDHDQRTLRMALDEIANLTWTPVAPPLPTGIN